MNSEWELANPLTLVGGNRPYHVMSVLLAEHSHSRGILGFLTYEDANNLRSVCKELRAEVTHFRWTDMKTRICGSLELWRTCFPHAISANLNYRGNLKYEDFVHLRGIKHLSLRNFPILVSRFGKMSFPDESFEYIRGIKSLDISYCTQLTDRAFTYLKGIHTLDMGNCNQATITDAAFMNLRGIQKLDMSWCNQATITDAAFMNLRGIRELDMSQCNQATITDAAFSPLEGIDILDMAWCKQTTITGASFPHLKIKTLNVANCNNMTIRNAIHLFHTQKYPTITNMCIQYLDFGYTYKIELIDNIRANSIAQLHLDSICHIVATGIMKDKYNGNVHTFLEKFTRQPTKGGLYLMPKDKDFLEFTVMDYINWYETESPDWRNLRVLFMDYLEALTAVGL